MRQVIIAAVVLIIGRGEIAAAEERETRWSLLGVLPTFATSDEASGTASETVWGGRFRGAYGIRDWLELGGDIGLSGTMNARFVGATIPNLVGSMIQDVPAVLYADLYVPEVAANARFLGPTLLHWEGVTRPFIEIRGGALIRILASQDAFTRDLTSHVPGRSGTNADLLLFVGGTAGVEYRFADVYAVGLAADYTYAGDRWSGIGAGVELSWFRYSAL